MIAHEPLADLEARTLEGARAAIRAASNGFWLTPEAHIRRETALERLPYALQGFSALDFGWYELEGLYMFCSYGRTANRHAVKPEVSRLFREAAAEWGIALDYTAGSPIKGRIAVLLNYWNPLHVMYRDYAGALRHLKAAGYETIAYTIMPSQADDVFCGKRFVGQSSIDLNFLAWATQLIETIARDRPEMLLLPDTAMHPLNILCANVRIAPHQLALTGHPVGTFAAQLDGLVAERAFEPCAAQFPEGLVLTPDEESAIGLPAIPMPEARKRSGRLQIAVPGTIIKLNYPFLAACERVRARLGAELHIFTCDQTRRFEELWPAVQAVCPGSYLRHNVFGRGYLEQLGQYDFALMPWAFSGLNTVADCLAMGLPPILLADGFSGLMPGVIALQQSAPELSTDLIAATTYDYEEKAVALIENRRFEPARALLRERFGSEHLERLPLFSNPQTGLLRAVSVRLR